MVDPLLFDPLQSFLVALQGGFHRLQQCLELGLAGLVCLREPLARFREEILVRLLQKLVADLAELVDQLIPRLLEVGHARLEVAGVGL